MDSRPLLPLWDRLCKAKSDERVLRKPLVARVLPFARRGASGASFHLDKTAGPPTFTVPDDVSVDDFVPCYPPHPVCLSALRRSGQPRAAWPVEPAHRSGHIGDHVS